MKKPMKKMSAKAFEKSAMDRKMDRAETKKSGKPEKGFDKEDKSFLKKFNKGKK